MFCGNQWLLYGGSFSIVTVLMGIYVPGLNSIFGMAPIDRLAWAKVAVAVVVHLFVVEAGKYAIRSVKPASEAAVAKGGGLRSPEALVGKGVEEEEEEEGRVVTTGAGEVVA